MDAIPKIRDLYNDIFASLQSEFTGIIIPILGKVFLRAYAAVLAAKLMLYYYQLAKVQKNIFPDTAEPEASGGTLERSGRIKINRNPFPARQGQYEVTVTGTVGAIIKAGTTFVSGNDTQNPGKVFQLDNQYTLVATTDSITVRALEAGIDSKLNTGEVLIATVPLNNVNTNVVVASTAIAPQAPEDIEDYRQKVLQAFRLEPQGGATGDYILWASDAQGVKRAYPYNKSGAPTEINLFIEATVADSTDGKGTPTPTILSDVEAVIALDPDTTKPMTERGRLPMGVFEVHVLPIVLKQVDIQINSYIGITADKQATILAALQELIASIRPFIDGADVEAERKDTLDANLIAATIINAVPGSIFAGSTLKINTINVPSFNFDQGNIPFLNSVTYV